MTNNVRISTKNFANNCKKVSQLKKSAFGRNHMNKNFKIKKDKRKTLPKIIENYSNISLLSIFIIARNFCPSQILKRMRFNLDIGTIACPSITPQISSIIVRLKIYNASLFAPLEHWNNFDCTEYTVSMFSSKTLWGKVLSLNFVI